MKNEASRFPAAIQSAPVRNYSEGVDPDLGLVAENAPPATEDVSRSRVSG